MPTLIAVFNSSGCVGRCDKHCHDARSPAGECDCICGGRNHGVGLREALEITERLFRDGLPPEDVARFAAAHGFAAAELRIAERRGIARRRRPAAPRQGPLVADWPRAAE